jgi:hypothetical protein
MMACKVTPHIYTGYTAAAPGSLDEAAAAKFVHDDAIVQR